MASSHLNDITTIQNIRDLGGYPTDRGQTTRHGRFLRSGDLDRVSTADQRALIEYGVTTVIDLRMRRELVSLPNQLRLIEEVHYVNHDFWGDRFSSYRSWRRGAPPETKLADLYCDGLRENGFVIADVMRTIGETKEDCVLFHCRSGKDRTGLVAALLLSIAGVDKETVCEDYALTSKAFGTRGYSTVRPGEPGYYLTGCSPITMKQTLEHLDNVYGGCEGYLESVGVSRSEIELISAKLTD